MAAVVRTIRNRYVVTEMFYERDLKAFALDTLDGEMMGVLFPYNKEQEDRIFAALASEEIDFDQAGMEWLSEDSKALYEKMEG